MQVREMLERRTDLSTFVVHLTKQTGASARENLRSILMSKRINAVTAMGAAASRLDEGSADWNSQRVVCFMESPLEQLYSFFVDFDEERRHKFQPYGRVSSLTALEVRDALEAAMPSWTEDAGGTASTTTATARGASERIGDVAIDPNAPRRLLPAAPASDHNVDKVHLSSSSKGLHLST